MQLKLHNLNMHKANAIESTILHKVHSAIIGNNAASSSQFRARLFLFSTSPKLRGSITVMTDNKESLSLLSQFGELYTKARARATFCALCSSSYMKNRSEDALWDTVSYFSFCIFSPTYYVSLDTTDFQSQNTAFFVGLYTMFVRVY